MSDIKQEVQTIRIDSRVIGFSEEPIRILALCSPDDGLIRVEKLEKFSNFPVLPKYKHNTIIVTDAPHQVLNWQLKFVASEHLEEVMQIYQQRRRAGLVDVEKNLAKFRPDNILQVRKVDQKGQQQEFDSSALNNGHIAVLLAIWASHKISIGNAVISPVSAKDDHIDRSMLPFSI